MRNRSFGVIVACIAMACFGAAVAGQESVLVELNIKLPKPIQVGTPKGIKGTNLDPLRKEGKRSAFLVPEGVTLLSKGKVVTSSDSNPVNGSLDLIADGDKESVDGSFVELGPCKQWIQVDLGAACDVYVVVAWHFHSEARVYRDVIVQMADDADFITNVRTIFNNDNDNTSGLGIGKDYEYIENFEGKLIDAKKSKGRYVRFYSNGSTAGEANHYIEVEVYGRHSK